MLHSTSTRARQHDDVSRPPRLNERGRELSPPVSAWSEAESLGRAKPCLPNQVGRLHSMYGNQAILRALSARATAIQTKLTVNQPGDQYEQEADRVADHVMSASEPAVQRSCACAGSGSECAECKERALHRSGSTPTATVPAPPIVDDVVRSPGHPLDSATRAFMEPRFGHDFGHVRIHTDARASDSAKAVNALAYTTGNSIVFAAGHNPHSMSGRRLLAHELAHVVQQGSDPSGPQSVQRTTFVGTENQCVAFEDRELQISSGAPLTPTGTPGGHVIPGTRGSSQNCAGASMCGRAEYINWPFLGLQAADGVARPPQITADWDAANYFVPAGCKPVDCGGVSLNASRCLPSEREVILFLYRWPAGILPNTAITVYQSDFHMIGRTPSSLPMAWESKMDRRERVDDIRDPWQSLHDAYPHTTRPDREVRQHCFCCDCGQVTTR